MSLIQAIGLGLRFPGQVRPVLQDINLTVHPGERILLLGPSGAGKSSLLLALTGLAPRSIEAEVSGQVRLDGLPVVDLSPDQVCRRIGLLFQEPESQFCMINPDDEIAFGLENLGLPSSGMLPRIEAACNQVGLDRAQRETRIDQLSGGQQQRLALASILAQEPALLFLDEPTANLDPAGRREVVNAAADVAKAGRGLLVVEHNLDPWLPLLDRVIILTPEGRLLADGPPADLFVQWGRYLDQVGIWRPRSTRVADLLIGSGIPCNPYPLTPTALAGLSISPEGTLRAAVDQVVGTREEVERGQPGQDGPMVSIKDVTIGYGKGAPVLRDITLELQPGAFCALIGANGSGKSTLARALIGMLQPTRGSVEVLGTEVRKLNPNALAERVGYVFQNPEHQFVTDSVWDELAFSLRHRKVPLADRRDRIEESLAFFGLKELEAANPFSLSGGQKRRLSVATMLVGGQRLLILDEPTYGQDQRSADQLMERISVLHKQGMTIVMITHDMDLVDRYAGWAAVLQNGRIAYSGDPAGLWPRTDLLASCHLEQPFRAQVLGGLD